MPTLDEQIAQALADAQASGELRAAPSWGKPLALDDGWDDTPVELRLPFKILKDAGFRPPEVAWMHEIAALRAQADAEPDPARAAPLRARIAELQQRLALRLEALRVNGAL